MRKGHPIIEGLSRETGGAIAWPQCPGPRHRTPVQLSAGWCLDKLLAFEWSVPALNSEAKAREAPLLVHGFVWILENGLFP